MEREGIVLNIERSTDVAPDVGTISAEVIFIDRMPKDIIDLELFGFDHVLSEDKQAIIQIAKDKSIVGAREAGVRSVAETIEAVIGAGYPREKLMLSGIRTRPAMETFNHTDKKVGGVNICIGYAYCANISVAFEGVDKDTELMKKVYAALVASRYVSNVQVSYSLSHEREDHVKEGLLLDAIEYANKKAANIGAAMNEHYHVEPVYFNMLSRSHDTGGTRYLRKASAGYDSLDDDMRYLDSVFDPAFVGERNVNVTFEIHYQIQDMTHYDSRVKQ